MSTLFLTFAKTFFWKNSLTFQSEDDTIYERAENGADKTDAEVSELADEQD